MCVCECVELKFFCLEGGGRGNKRCVSFDKCYMNNIILNDENITVAPPKVDMKYYIGSLLVPVTFWIFCRRQTNKLGHSLKVVSSFRFNQCATAVVLVSDFLLFVVVVAVAVFFVKASLSFVVILVTDIFVDVLLFSGEGSKVMIDYSRSTGSIMM